MPLNPPPPPQNPSLTTQPGAFTPPLAPLSNDAELTKTFNSAMVSTTVRAAHPPEDLARTFRSAEFRSILEAVRRLARLESISEKEAAEKIIRVFRQVDATWADYVIQEGLAAVRGKFEPKSAK